MLKQVSNPYNSSICFNSAVVISGGDKIFKKHYSSFSCSDLQARYEQNASSEDINGISITDAEGKYEVSLFHISQF